MTRDAEVACSKYFSLVFFGLSAAHATASLYEANPDWRIPAGTIRSTQCQGGVAACSGGWILITWCLARTILAAFGLVCMRFVGIGCEGPAGVT